MATSSRSRPAQPNAAEMRQIQEEEAHPYVINSEIGKGSFATVFKGYHEKTRKAVAIKTISRAILTHKLLENLESEIAILKALNHKHITELKDIVKAPRNIYLIMEYCSGGDLSNYIRHRGKIEGLEYSPTPGSPPQYWPHAKSGGLDSVVVRSFLGQLAQAMKFLRDRNLIHRDIKPQNLLLEPSTPDDAPIPLGIPVLKIADFGFARSLPNATLAETLCGSPLYMAPEILRYEKYDAKADLWSVGAVLYEMSVGKPPFRAQNHMELLKKIEHARGRVNFPDEVALAREARGEKDSSRGDTIITVVPSDIKVLIRMLLKRKPVERASFEDFFASDAIRSEFGEKVSSSDPSTTPSNPGEPSKRNSDPFSPPPQPKRQHRDRSQKERENADRDVSPLEGTPYDPKFYNPQPAFRFRRSQNTSSEGEEQTLQQPRIVHAPDRPHRPNALNAEPSILDYHPSNTAVVGSDESMNGSKRDKEYVLVDDTKAVEFNRVADEIVAARNRPPTSRTTSTGVRGAATAAAITKQVGRLVIGVAVGTKDVGVPIPSIPPSPAAFAPEANLSPNNNTPPFATTHRRSDPTSSTLLAKTPPQAVPVPVPVPMTFPPPPNPIPSPSQGGFNVYYPDNSGPGRYGTPQSQPSALARALNMASKKLFGSPTNLSSSPSSQGVLLAGHNPNQAPNGSMGSSGGSPRPPLILPETHTKESGKRYNAAKGKARDAEEAVLATVEEIAQKAQVLKEFADKKFAKVEALQSKPLADPSQFARRKGEASGKADSRRKKEMEAEQNAVHSIAIYITVMAFSQKGINALNKYCQDHLDDFNKNGEVGEWSTGIDDALAWFRETFKTCVERSEITKGCLPEGHQTTSMWVDRVIYDYALAVLKQAAAKELLEENYAQIESEYERALWMLYAISDDVIQEGNPYSEQDVQTISGFIDTTKTRLMRLRRRIETRRENLAARPSDPSPNSNTIST